MLGAWLSKALLGELLSLFVATLGRRVGSMIPSIWSRFVSSVISFCDRFISFGGSPGGRAPVPFRFVFLSFLGVCGRDCIEYVGLGGIGTGWNATYSGSGGGTVDARGSSEELERSRLLLLLFLRKLENTDGLDLRVESGGMRRLCVEA